eukprot:NODE_2528_length_776_cov_333.504814_g1761_i0.p2 GENE.NODE_2528_length_776_cov_333.504814_g1761_i0~~NODE_2528_length_776_cov_333.504814_g1761_i0.p2  ORF type:complete len:195 (-),score=66.02 NODE_2528_length_776_cov_333.504814_g1761_i0:192-752(-)
MGDEYQGIPDSHPGSFRRFLRERFVDLVPLKRFVGIPGEGNAEEVCRRLTEDLSPRTVDVAFLGIGNNGHIAFNDPPADFEAKQSYLPVNLDEVSRQQQVSQGWFPDMEAMPKQAITMSIHQILQAKCLVCAALGTRKAQVVKEALEGPLTNMLPASILREHPNASLYLDPESAALLAPSMSSSSS